MIVAGRFYCDTCYDLDHHFKWFQPNALNLDLSRTTHLDHDSQVCVCTDTRTTKSEAQNNSHTIHVTMKRSVEKN